MNNLAQLISFSFILILASCQAGSGSVNDGNDQTVTPFVDLDLAAFEEKMKNDNVVILDVRTPEETKQGMINGAIEIDYRSSDFADKLKVLDKDKTYLVYCKSGGRSVGACNLMAEEGFKDLHNLLGGYQEWAEKH